MKQLKKYIALCGLLVFPFASHAQIELIDLGWVYQEYAVSGYVGVKNISNQEIKVRGVRSSEDNVMNYEGGKLTLPPNQGTVVHYKSHTLSRKFPGDQRIICDWENHKRKKDFYIPVKLVIERENNTNQIIEERFVPSLSSLKKDNSKKLTCFSEPAFSSEKLSDDSVSFMSALSSFLIHKKSEKEFLIRGKLVFENQSNSTYELLDITSEETKKNGLAKNKRYESLLTQNLSKGYNIINFQWEVKKLPKYIDQEEILVTTIVLSLRGELNSQEVRIPVKLSVQQLLSGFNFNTTKQ